MAFDHHNHMMICMHIQREEFVAEEIYHWRQWKFPRKAPVRLHLFQQTR